MSQHTYAVPESVRQGEGKIPAPRSGAGVGRAPRSRARTRALAVLSTLLALLLPALPAAAAVSDPADAEGGFLLRLGGDAVVASSESVGAVVVVEGDASVAGLVGAVVVVNGTATLMGATVGTLVVVDGDAVLGEGTVVTEDVVLANSVIKEDGSVRIEGDVVEDLSAFRRAGDVFDVVFNIFGVLFALGGALLTLGAAALFAAIAPRTLRSATAAIKGEPGGVALSGVLFWFALPAVAVAALLTVVGAPTAFAIWFVVLPATAAAGYLVTGFWIGQLLMARGGMPHHPYGQALLGTVLLLAVGLVPFLGALVTFAASLVGGSALVLLAWREFRSRGSGDATPSSPPQPPATT